MNIFKALILLSFTFLSACSSTSIPYINDSAKLDRVMYLRGVFNWWEADDSFKLIKQPDGSYMTSVELIADGQPYDFKIADANWSQGFNCGYLHKSNDEVVTLNRLLKADCNTTANNFKFTPKQTGSYSFYVNFSNLANPSLVVRKN